MGGSGAIGPDPILQPNVSNTVRAAGAVLALIFVTFLFAFMSQAGFRLAMLNEKLRTYLSKRTKNLLLAAVGSVSISATIALQADRDALHGAYDLIGQRTVFWLALLAFSLSAFALTDAPELSFIVTVSTSVFLMLGIPIVLIVPIVVIVSYFTLSPLPLYSMVFLSPITLWALYAVPTYDDEIKRSLSMIIILFPLIQCFYLSYRLERPGAKWMLAGVIFGLIMYIPFYSGVAFVSSQSSGSLAFTVAVFWGLLPAMNAVWDRMSLFVSFKLLRNLSSSLARHYSSVGAANSFDISVRWSSVAILKICIHIAIDLILALCFMLLMFTSVIATLLVVNSLFAATVPSFSVDLDHYFSAFLANPISGDGIWISVVIASTLLPTVIHFASAFSGIFYVAMETPNVRQAFLDIMSPSSKSYQQSIRRIARYSAYIFFAGASTVAMLIYLIFYAFEFLLGSNLFQAIVDIFVT